MKNNNNHLDREVKVDYDEGFINGTKINLYASLEITPTSLAQACIGDVNFVDFPSTSISARPTIAAIATGSTTQVGSSSQ
jgi:hypothetical protein